MDYRSAVRFLDSLVNYERQTKPRNEFKLDNIRRLLNLAGNPQERLGKVILIAGTKGKGSVSYLVEAGLRGCGFQTGLYVSPHVLSVRERIQLQGELVKKAVFARLVKRFQPLVRRQPVSYFELLTALAFEIFSRQRIEYPVIEVGLGGRLDATNLSDPAVSVITRIGYDHIQVLGSTLSQIAREKAGIMRPGRTVVIGPQVEEARLALKAAATQIGAQAVWVEERSRVWDEQVGADGVGFSCFTELGAGRVSLRLLGRHQIENCRIALTVLGVLARNDSRIQFEPAVRAMADTTVPARCQLVIKNPPVVVDSCHNPESGAALAGVLKECFPHRVILIYGSLRKKLVRRTLLPIAPYVESAIAVAPNSPRAMAPTVLKGIFTRLKVRAETASDLASAIRRARELSGGRLPVVIAGSFYLAGEALALLGGGPTD